MTCDQQTVFIIDDEKQSRESIRALVQSMQYKVQTYDSAENFLQQYENQPGCLVTDYRMVGMNGLELQEKLSSAGYTIPVILVTAYARTPITVQAIRNGAVSVLDKPYSEDELWRAIREGLTLDEKKRLAKEQQAEITSRLESLNEKEKEVLELLMAGEPNKVMASKIDVSLRTIENRRRSVFTKLGTQTVAELVTVVLKQRNTFTGSE